MHVTERFPGPSSVMPHKSLLRQKNFCAKFQGNCRKLKRGAQRTPQFIQQNRHEQNFLTAL
jgi:hypothetical protein